MCDEHNTTRFRFWRRLIRLIGVIVPRRLRARFRREWEAELEYREALLSKWDRLDWRSELELFRRSLGAFWDALWLQPRRLEDEVFQDLRFGMRILARSPAFALAAILSLAIGIGANTALFSVVNAVLWRQLPYPHAERLVRVGEWNTRAEFVALSRAQRSFDVLAGWSDRDFILNGGGAPTQLKAMRITPEFLPLLGVTPQAGRAFNAEEFHPGRDQVALISDRLWRGHFGADPRLIGQAVTLDDRRYTVVGVTPPGFDFFPAVDLLTPLALAADDLRQENYYGMGIVARL
ncbi:MAG: ABC transporter permease, partial [Blastocatellia bacterium]|nr:ABC transporter permease [Blastocatellia bacterium]